MIPGQASWLSGHRRILSLPKPHSRLSGSPCGPQEDSARRLQWRDRSRFARPFLFSPTYNRGHRGNQSFQRTTNRVTVPLGAMKCQALMRAGQPQLARSQPRLCGPITDRLMSVVNDQCWREPMIRISEPARSVRARFATCPCRARRRGCPAPRSCAEDARFRARRSSRR